MKVLLINPKDRGYYYKLGLNFPPLGLAYLSAVLRGRGHGVDIVDMNVQRFDYEKFDYSGYDLVGISSDTVRFPLASRIARAARSRNARVVMGGPHPSFTFVDILERKVADYVVIGEGERAIVELADALSSGERYPDIKGLAYMRDGEVLVNPVELICDLDAIPFPDRDNLPLDRYPYRFDGKYATSLITSRGCPFRCEFCAASEIMGGRWRQRSVENVIEEIELLWRKYGFGSLIFFDDNFTLLPKRAIAISESILRKGIKLSWWAFGRADEIVRNEDMVEAMSEAGCRMMFVGFESGSDEVLREYGKKLKSNISLDAIRVLRKYGIDVFGSFIIGALSETRGLIERTINFARKLDLEITQFSVLTPYPGTRLFEKLSSLLTTRNWSLFDGTRLVFRHPNLTTKQIEEVFFKAYFLAYTKPRRLFRRGLPLYLKIITGGLFGRRKVPLVRKEKGWEPLVRPLA